MRQHAYLELMFALVVGACGTGAGSGSGSGCVACCIVLCSCCSGWHWVSASAVPFGLRIFCSRFPSRASFFPGLLLFVPAGVSGSHGCFFVPASRHFVFPDWCFLRPKRGFGFPQMSCVPAMVFFLPAREKFI